MPGFRKGNWPKMAIGGLVLLNLVLLAVLVLREPTRPLAAAPVAPSGSATASARPAETPLPTATPSPRGRTPTPSSAESSLSPMRSTRVLAVNSGTLAWRAVVGPCPTDPKVEVSRDGGRTWRRTAPGLKSVSRLRSYSDSAVFAVGGAADCDPRYVATGGPGESWGPNERLLGQTWYRLPGETDRVHAPDGGLSSPCGPRLRDFTGLGQSNAAAVCSGGTVRLTQNGGDSWRDLKGVSDGLAIGADETVYVLAVRRASCDGAAIVVLNPGAKQFDNADARCAAVGRMAGEKFAVGVRGRVLWLWAGSTVAVSTDRGQEWSGV